MVVVLLAAWDLHIVRSHLEDGRRSLDDLTLDLAASEGLAGVADDAALHLDIAADRADRSLALSALSLLPVVDDQVEGIRRMTGATAQLGASAWQAAARLDRELERAGEPAGRVALLDAALEEIDRIEADLGAVDLGSPAGLLGPLRDAHDDLVASISSARRKLDEGRDLVEPVREMFVGPTTFMLLAANNAEMAGGAGLALSAGGLSFRDGDIELSDVVPARQLRLDDSVPLPQEIAEIYAPTGVGLDFRSTTRSPNLPTMAPITAAMAKEGLDVEVDGVLVVDAVALQSLMDVTGGVRVDGVEIDADNVLEQVLNESYKQFADAEQRDERDAFQGVIAKAVFDAVTERDVPAVELVDALLDASAGRHLMLWSQRPELEDVWKDLGVAGELNEHGLMVSFQNYAANKLDWYLRPEAALDVSLAPNGDYRAHLSMTLPMPSIADLEDASPYILGPTPEQHGLFLTVHLPAAAYDITTPDEEGFRTKGRDGPMQVRTFRVDVPMGSTLERSIDFTLPREDFAMVLLPSARVEPVHLTIDGQTTVTDAEPTFITWDAALVASAVDDGIRLPVRVLAVLGFALTLAAASAAAVPVVRGARSTGRDWLVVARASAVAALIAFAAAGTLALLLSVPRV